MEAAPPPPPPPPFSRALPANAFSRRMLEAHIRRGGFDGSTYVDYRLLRKAVHHGVTDGEFEALYAIEVEKLGAHVDVEAALAADPLFVAVNRAALAKACRKLDRRSSGEGLVVRRRRVAAERRQALVSQFEATEALAAELFSKLDASGSGAIQTEQLRAGLIGMQLPATQALIDELMAAADSAGDGVLLARDFRRLVTSKEAALREAWLQIDTDSDGLVDKTDIIAAATRLGLEVAESDIEEMLARAQQSAQQNIPGGRVGSAPTPSGSIDYAAFRALLVLASPSDVGGKALLRYWASAADLGMLPEHSSEQSPAALDKFIAGGIAGAVSRTITAPFDRLKMLMIVESRSVGPQYTGIWQGLRKIYMDGKLHNPSADSMQWVRSGDGRVAARGWRGILAGCMAFFHGNGTNVVKITPESAIRFWVYSSVRPLVCKDARNERPSERLVAGALAGMAGQIVVYPLEVVKTRKAVSSVGTYNGITHAIFKIARQEGAPALYQGLGASLCGIVPYAGVDMAVYFTLRERLIKAHREKHGNGHPSVFWLAACGAVSSTCGQVCAYPMQLVRTRMQAQGLPGMPRYVGIRDCVHRTVQSDGLPGLYRGFLPNCA